MIFVVSLPMWCLSLFGQQSPAVPYWRSCAAEEMKSAITDVNYAASQTLNLKPIHSRAIVSRFNLNLTELCTMASYAAADCHFRQDAHRRIRRAEESERGEHAQDHQSVNGEKIFMSLTSAECTEVEYATERYSESSAPVGTKTDMGDTVQRKRGRDFALCIQVELDSSSDEAPTSSRSFYLQEIHCQIDHNEMLQRRLAHSTKLLRDAERIAMGEENAIAPQAVRPLAQALPPAPIPPLDWRQISSSKCPDPPLLCMRPAKITRHKVYFQRTFLKHVGARLHRRLKRHAPTVATRH
jgi:hypothetical protein